MVSLVFSEVIFSFDCRFLDPGALSCFGWEKTEKLVKNRHNKIINSYNKANININTDAFAKLRKNFKKLHTLIIGRDAISISPPSAP